MGLIIWLIIGGVVGWLASIIMRTDAQQGILLNIVVGIVGAFIGGLILGRGTINDTPLNLTSFLVSLVGAIILIPLQTATNTWFGGGGSGLTYILYGGVILLIARFEPGGVMDLVKRARWPRRGRRGERSSGSRHAA